MIETTIEIAGVRLALSGQNPHLRDLLHARFAAFSSTAQAPDFRLELECSGDSIELAADGEEVSNRKVSPQRFELVAGSFRCSLDLGQRHGRIVSDLRAQPIDTAVRLVLAHELVARGKLLLHASAIVTDTSSRSGALFIGPSGAGKTTIATTLPGQILSDEACVLSIGHGGPIIEGTPYWGAEHSGEVLAGAVLFVAHGAEQPSWQPLSRAHTAALLAAHAGPFLEPMGERVFDVASAIAEYTPQAAQVVLSSKTDIIEWLEPRIRTLNART